MAKVKRLIAKITMGAISRTIDDTMIDASFEDLDRANVSDLLSFGIYANRGSLTFVDKGNFISNALKRYRKGIDGAKVEFYLVKDETERLIRTFLIQDFDADEETNIVSLELISKIIKWQELTIPTIYIVPSENSLVFVEEIINDYINPIISSLYGFSINIAKQRDYLFFQTRVYCPYIQEDSLWNVMTKICELCGGRIYEGASGSPYIYSDFSRFTKPHLVVKPKNILSIENNSPTYKNLMRDVSVIVKDREKKFNAPIDNGISFTILEDGGAFIVDNPQNTNVSINVGEIVSHKWLADIECIGNSSYQLTNDFSVSITVIKNNSDGSKTSEVLTPQASILLKENGDYVVSIKDFVIYDFEQNWFLTTAKIQVNGTYFVDKEDKEIFSGEQNENHQITSNDLFQTKNLYLNDNHTEWYLKQCVASTQRDCFECECTFSDYYDSNGSLALDSSSNKLQTFDRTRAIIPYVMRKGIEVPFSRNGTAPSPYKIVGIKYNYKGILRQKLYLQSYEPLEIPNESIGLEFTSNGDGTCYVSGMGECPDFDIIIPSKSPSGDEVTAIGEAAFVQVEGDLFNPDAMFSQITSVVIPSTVKVIERGAFAHCINLQSIKIPDSVITIKHLAFANCTNLADITIPKSVVNMGYGIFYRCYNLDRLVVPFVGKTYGLTGYYDKHWVTSLMFQFSLCDEYSEYELIEGVDYNDYKLSSVSITEDTTRLNDYALAGLIKTKNILLPNKVEIIGNNAFTLCGSITNIRIPNGATTISNNAFAGCISLTSITIPDSVTSIGSGAFYACNNLEGSIDIPDGQTEIGGYTFDGCKSITEVYIPKSVTRIGNDAFSRCYLLEYIYYAGTETEWNNISKSQTGEEGLPWDYEAGKDTVRRKYKVIFNS